MNKTVVLLGIFIQIASIICLTTWPLPSSISQGGSSIGIDPSTFLITTNSTSQILQTGINRYISKGLIFPFTDTDAPITPTLTSLTISVLSNDETLQLGFDESYTLNLPSGSSTGTITSNSIWGALRALETFSQLVDYSDTENNYAINCIPTVISDAPRFEWRFVFNF